MIRLGLSMGRAGLAALALAAAPVLAQQTSDFRLPPGETPRPAGPVDPEPPAATTPAPSTSPAPPRIVLPPPPKAAATPTTRPSPRPTAATPAARPTPAPRPTTAAPAATTPAPAAVATPAPSPAAATALPEALPTDPVAGETPAPEPLPAPPPAEAAEEAPWPAIAAGAGLILAIVLMVWLLRRGRAARIAATEERLAAASLPTPPSPAVPPASRPAAPQPAAPAAPPSSPAQSFAPLPRGEFALALEPLRMTLAMINATFVYRLTISNPGPVPLGPLRISSDMISAHASLATAEQLVPDPAQAWLAHEFEAIPPGESIVIDGELRLPRAELRPIRSGNSAIFVPLARFTLQSLAGGMPSLVGARVFVIGEEPEQPGGPVRAFSLNGGTRSYSRISQREVAIA